MRRQLLTSKLSSKPRTRAPQRRSTATRLVPLTPTTFSSFSTLSPTSSSPTTLEDVASTDPNGCVAWMRTPLVTVLSRKNLRVNRAFLDDLGRATCGRIVLNFFAVQGIKMSLPAGPFSWSTISHAFLSHRSFGVHNHYLIITGKVLRFIGCGMIGSVHSVNKYFKERLMHL